MSENKTFLSGWGYVKFTDGTYLFLSEDEMKILLEQIKKLKEKGQNESTRST
jgi:hypothetical protein